MDSGKAKNTKKKVKTVNMGKFYKIFNSMEYKTLDEIEKDFQEAEFILYYLS